MNATSVLWGCVILSVPWLSGCVGRRQALAANEALVASCQRATNKVAALREATQAEVQAHKKARETVREFRREYFKARIAQGQKQAESDYLTTLAEINGVLSQKQAEIVSTWKVSQNDLEKQVDLHFKPVADALAGLQRGVESARTNVGEFSGDQGRKLALETKRRTFAQTAALARQSEYGAYMKATLALAEEVHRSLQRLEEVAERYRKGTKAVYERTLTTLPTEPPDADLGPEPEDNAAVYDELLQYAEQIEKVALANKEYLVANSFGVGSYFEGFIRAFGSGLVSRVFNPSKSGNVTFKDLKLSGKDLGDSILSNFKDNLLDAKRAFAGEVSAMVDNFKKEAAEKLSATVREAVPRASIINNE
jgi:hypothetical protein